MEKNETMDINKLAGGAIQEAINFALEEIFKNIKDPNTEAERSRKLQITLDFKPDETRQIIKTKIATKQTLVPVNSITTQLFLDSNGEDIVATELTKQDPNQVSIDDYNDSKIVNLNKELEKEAK